MEGFDFTHAGIRIRRPIPFAIKHPGQDNNSNPSPPPLMMPAVLKSLGPIRLTLYLATLAILPFAFIATPEAESKGLTIISEVAPALAVLLFFVLMLDALMNKVFGIDAAQEEKSASFRLRSWLSLTGAGLVLLCWGPFFSTLVG